MEDDHGISTVIIVVATLATGGEKGNNHAKWGNVYEKKTLSKLLDGHESSGS